jgi:hypothetical protein
MNNPSDIRVHPPVVVEKEARESRQGSPGRGTMDNPLPLPIITPRERAARRVPGVSTAPPLSEADDRRYKRGPAEL